MLATQFAELLDGDLPGVDEALTLVTGFDECLMHGLARLDETRTAALAALSDVLAATPLRDQVAEAVEKVTAGSISGEHLTALAGARSALLGAVHDALLAGFDAALGRARSAWEQLDRPEAATPPPATDNLLRGCRSWLQELAITGWRGVDHDLVSTSSETVEALLADPGLRRLALLLDGMAAELRASSPIATMDRLPARRWADLWARGVLLARAGGRPGGVASTDLVSGRLLILGVDVHEHSTAVQMQVHGVLEPAGGAPSRLVRTSVAATKVDTIVGPALWRLFGSHPVLLGALAEHRSLEVTELPLLAGGDLIWRDDRVRAGEPANPFATARVQLGGALAPAVPPLDRHPARIAEPVLVEGYTATIADGGEITFELADQGLAVTVDRLPACGPLTPELVAASSACLGLVRWDGGHWLLQPFAIQATVKRKQTEAHNGDWALGPTDPKVLKAEARSGDAVAVLRERAGRLLRR